MLDLLGDGFGGIFAIIILILDVMAIIQVIQSPKDLLAKILWIVVILALPIVGLILYYILGRD